MIKAEKGVSLHCSVHFLGQFGDLMR